MARSSLPLLLLPLCLLPFFFTLSLSADTYCTTLTTSLTPPCESYFSNSSAAPSSSCCTHLKPDLDAANLNKTIQCLCGIGSSSAALQQRALQLPKSCNINATIPNSPCSANSTGTNGTSGSARVLSALVSSYAAITFTSLISSVLTGALLI